MAEAPPRIPTPQALPESLSGPLARLENRQRGVSRLAAVGLSLTIVLSGLAVLGWVDFLAELAATVRLGGLLVLSAAVLVTFAWWIRRGRRECRVDRLAASIDRHAGSGGEVLAGAELAAETLEDPVSRGLAAQAVERAGRFAGKVEPREIVPTGRAAVTWKPAGIVFGLLVLLGVIWPSIFGAHALRILDPLGDHPPYSPYRFAVEPGNARVFFGDPMSIKVTATGEELPERVEWILEKEDGTRAVYPLLDQGEGRFTGTVGLVDQPITYHVRGPEGRSGRFTVDVIYTPRIEEVSVRTVPPEYTGRTPYEGKIPEGGLLGVEGTEVTLTVRSNRPLSGGKLTWKSESKPATDLEPVESAEGGGVRVAGVFQIDADGEFTVTVTDVDGNACREPLVGRVVLLPDRRPTVTLLEPPAESYATPSAVIPVVMEADDDFGLTRAGLYRSLNGTRDHGSKLELPAEKGLPVRLVQPLQLKDWGLDPGDVLECYAVVADNDPRGAKTAQSKVHRIRIISEKEYQTLLRAQERIEDLTERYRPIEDALQEAREQAKKLAKALEEMEKASTPEEREAAQKAAAEALDRMRAAMDEASRMAREESEAPPVFDIDEAFHRDLKKLADRLDEMKKQSGDPLEKLAKQLQGSPSGPPSPQDLEKAREALKKLARGLGESGDEYQEQVTHPLEVMEKVYRLMEFEARFTALALAQADLARRTRRFGDRGKIEDAAELEEMRGLEEEQRFFEGELAEVLQGIRDSAARLPKGEPFDQLRAQAEEFATAVVEAKAPEALEKATGSLGRREGDASAKDTQAAADLLMSFVSRCQGMAKQGKGACLKFQPKLANGMGNTLEQLLAGLGLPGSQSPGSQSGGLGMGPAGRGGSTGAQRTLQNMGLYGSRARTARGGGRRGKTKGDGGVYRRGLATGTAGGAGAYDGRTDLIYGGVPIEVVPGEYRAAVRDFFRRVTEESGRDTR